MTQDQLQFFASTKEESEWLVTLLHGRDWMTSEDILKEIGVPVTETGRRRIRSAAAASQGRVAGGQFGYKLVKSMTVDEYNRFRNWMTAQAADMQRRVLQSDAVFYPRKAVS